MPTSSSRAAAHVCVLGAGIVGLATAWQLHHDGFAVTVLDRAQPGQGASAANGAQLSYAYVQPLADPSIWLQLPRLLLSPHSPLTLRPRLDPNQWAWGLQFLAACRASVSRDTTALLLQLAAESRAGFDRLRSTDGVDCDFSATGKLVLYRDAAAFRAARRQLALQHSLGVQQQALTAADCVALEPALAHDARNITGAIHTPGECAADCLKVCQALHRILAAGGVRFLLDRPVTGLLCEGPRVAAVLTPQGPVAADAFVAALGTGSAALARMVGQALSVYPLKGYSITVPAIDAPGAAPRVNVTDAARKVVFARLGSQLRVAGMAELVGEDTQIPAGRIASLVASARAVFPAASDYTPVQGWAGLRPATPTGRPVIGGLPGAPANLLFNTGHGALGFTLAFGSAARIAAMLRGAIPSAAAPAACSG